MASDKHLLELYAKTPLTFSIAMDTRRVHMVSMAKAKQVAENTPRPGFVTSHARRNPLLGHNV
jgi:hypothetical protein